MGKKRAIKECTCCLTPAEYIDSLNNPWCERHSDRGKLLEYGKLTHWPYLDCFPYALAQGYEYWANAALVGTDDYIRVAVATIEATWNEEVPA